MTGPVRRDHRARGFGGRASAGGFRIARLLGVDVWLDWSLLIIFGLITFNLGVAAFPGWHPEWSTAMTWGMALAAAALFFASVVAHELSHAVVARTQGIPVRRITLFLFGGVAHMERQPPSPKAEFLMAAVGPVVSIAIGIGALVAGTLVSGGALRDAAVLEDPEALALALRQTGPVATLLLWLGPINVLLGLFNTIPGFPLDGGRVFRSVVWGITGNLKKATRWASGLGQMVGWGLVVVGVLQVVGGSMVQGLWLVLIGWFLNNAARSSYQQVVLHQALADVPVSRVMRTHMERVTPDLSVEHFVRAHVLAADQRAFPVEVGGQLVGIASSEDVRKVPQARWSDTSVEQIMTPAEHYTPLPPTAGAEEALEALGQRGVDQIPVMDEARRLVGLVDRRDFARWLALQ